MTAWPKKKETHAGSPSRRSPRRRRENVAKHFALWRLLRLRKNVAFVPCRIYSFISGNKSFMLNERSDKSPFDRAKTRPRRTFRVVTTHAAHAPDGRGPSSMRQITPEPNPLLGDAPGRP